MDSSIQHVVPDTNGDSSKDADSGSDDDSDHSSDEEIPVHGGWRGILRGITHGRAGRPAQKRVVMKHAGLWRSLILSTLDKTFYPYCHYIRTLNFHYLEKLLKDRNFRSKTRK